MFTATKNIFIAFALLLTFVCGSFAQQATPQPAPKAMLRRANAVFLSALDKERSHPSADFDGNRQPATRCIAANTDDPAPGSLL